MLSTQPGLGRSVFGLFHNSVYNRMKTLPGRLYYGKSKIITLSLLILSLVFTLSGCGPTNQPPNARFSANPTSGKPPLELSFDASESSDPDGEIVDYTWDFGNVEWNTGYGETENHEYENAGNYTVELTVTDDEGASDSAEISITVTSGPTDSPVDYRVTVTEIINEFDDNKLAAKEKYKGSTIAVTGNVSSVDTSTSSSQLQVHLDGTWVSSWYGVLCYFPKGQKDDLLELSEGDRITVVGDYDRWNGLNAVWIKGCYIE